MNRKALEELVRAAMAAGVTCFLQKTARREIDPNAPLLDAFDDYPTRFLAMRRDLVEGLEREETPE